MLKHLNGSNRFLTSHRCVRALHIEIVIRDDFADVTSVCIRCNGVALNRHVSKFAVECTVED